MNKNKIEPNILLSIDIHGYMNIPYCIRTKEEVLYLRSCR